MKSSSHAKPTHTTHGRQSSAQARHHKRVQAEAPLPIKDAAKSTLTAGAAAGTAAGTATGTAISDALDVQQAQALREENNAQREQLRTRLAELHQEISAEEASRSEAADALAASEQAISDANRKLHDLAQAQNLAQADLAAINQRRASAKERISSQQTRLAAMLHEQYLHGSDDPYKLLFSGDDPNRVAREMEYLGYVSRAQAALLKDLNASVAQLEDLSHQAAQRTQQLDTISAAQAAERQGLLADQDAHRATLAAISQKLQEQRAEAGNLTRDEARLSKVVDELAKLIERQARESRERARLAQRARDKAHAQELQAAKAAASEVHSAEAPHAEPARSDPAHTEPAATEVASINPPPTPSAAQGASETAPLAEFDGHFARLKGSLRLPVKGELIARFGATRSGGGPAWKGLFIEAPAGSEVHAVAPGRVVFAEWLRGFGNLLIIDHGAQYLSIYGNNEALLKQPGDVVQAGDQVATAGNSGGNPETGLYFELRYQGKPFDPLSWTSGR